MLQYIYRNLVTLSEDSSDFTSAGSAAGSSVSAQPSPTLQTSMSTLGNKGREDYIPDGNIVNRQQEQQQKQQGQQERINSTNITIATSANQVSSIRSQLGDLVGISIEPRRDTFPAIALATAYLHDARGVDKDSAVVVCPVDPYVEDSYFKVIADMYNLAASSD